MEEMKESSHSPVIYSHFPPSEAAPVQQIHGEEAILRVGGHHLFQVLTAVLLSYTASTGDRVTKTLPIMESNRIDLSCVDKTTGEPLSPCSVEEACHSGLYDFTYSHTGLVNWRVTYEKACTSEELFSLIGSCYFAGFLVGSLFMIPLSDYWGRKWLAVGGTLLQALLNVLLVFFGSFDLLYPYAFFLGLKSPMTTHIIFIWLGEFLSHKYRSFFTIIGVSFEALNEVWIALYFKFAGVWQYWFLFNALEILVSTLLVACLVPQSPRNLLARKKCEKARDVFRRIASVNRRPMFHERFIGEDAVDRSSLLSEDRAHQSQSKCRDLFRQGRRQVALLFVVPLLWVLGDMTAYGISFGLNRLSGDIYLNTFLIGCAAFSSQIFGAVSSSKLGRKPTIIIFWICAASGCLFYDFFHSHQTVGYVCVMIGKFGSTGAFCLMFLITVEIFPTAYRGRIYGISNAFARVGGILAPLIPDIVPHFMLLMAGLAVIGVLASLVLTETRGKKMEDDIEVKPRLSRAAVEQEDQEEMQDVSR